MLLHCVKSVQIGSFFWSAFSCIWTEYGDLRSTSLYSAWIIENTDQKKLPYLDTIHAVFAYLFRYHGVKFSYLLPSCSHEAFHILFLLSDCLMIMMMMKMMMMRWWWWWMIMNCFCGWLTDEKRLALFPTGTTPRFSNPPWAGFEPSQNLSSGFSERCVILITSTNFAFFHNWTYNLVSAMWGVDTCNVES